MASNTPKASSSRTHADGHTRGEGASGLSFSEFCVLNALRKSPLKTQRELARASKLSLGQTNKLVKALVSCGYIDKSQGSFTLSTAGLEALKPYRVEGAIIMAAGLSSRFAPLSYEKPKGLLKVRGETLIERQIRQLHEAGIHNITVVVGYKKEYFFYLKEQFGVDIVINNEYLVRNNHSSLYKVKQRLAQSYICSSDDYFTQNPFEAYQYRSSYSAVFVEGATQEWCLDITKTRRIKSLHIGGCNSFVMLGWAYFDRAFAHNFVRILEAEYPLPQTKDRLWESIWYAHKDELPLYVEPFDEGIIHEFDSLDEIRGFDPYFIENVNVDIFNNIAQVLECSKQEICDIYPLKLGLTNLSCHFRVGDAEYVYRHPGAGTEELVDREAELEALQCASRLGLDTSFVYANAQKGWKISRFIPDCVDFDIHNEDHLVRATALIRNLHASKAQVSRRFSFIEEALHYESLVEAHQEEFPADFFKMKQVFAQLESLVALTSQEEVLCHNDFFAHNLLVHPSGEIDLIDWEYAGMSDYAQDLGTFCVCCMLEEAQFDHLLTLYFEREPSLIEQAHCSAFVAFAGWCWYLWALYKETEGELAEDWIYTYYCYANTYLARSLNLYEKAGLKPVTCGKGTESL